MKKISALILSIIMSISILSGCGNNDSNEAKNTELTTQETSAITDGTAATTTMTTIVEDSSSLQTKFKEWQDVDEYTTGEITYSIPKSWDSVASDKDIELYRKFDAKEYTFSVQVQENYSVDLSMSEYDLTLELEKQYTQLRIKELNLIKINDIDCLKLLCRDKDEDYDFYKIVCQSNIGTVTFNFFDNTDYDYLNKQIESFISTIKNNIDFNEYYSEKSLNNLSLWDEELNEYHIDNLSYKLPKSYGEYDKNNLENSVQYVFRPVGGLIQVFEMNLDIDLSDDVYSKIFIDSLNTDGFTVTDHSTTEDGYLTFKALIDTEGKLKTYIKAVALNTDKHIVVIQIQSYSAYEEAESVFDVFYRHLSIEKDTSTSKAEAEEPYKSKTSNNDSYSASTEFTNPSEVSAWSWKGSGDYVAGGLQVKGFAVLSATYNGSGNFIVHAFNTDNDEKTYLFNEIGSYSGNALLVGDGTYEVEIKSDGNWNISANPLSMTDSDTFSGRGSVVTGIFMPPGTKWSITHDGSRNFIVHKYSANSGKKEYLVNEIGPYSGIVKSNNSDYSFFTIEADGNWTITPVE